MIWVNIGSGNGLLPENSKPVPEPVLTDHQWVSEAFIWRQFHWKCSRYLSLIKITVSSPRGHWVEGFLFISHHHDMKLIIMSHGLLIELSIHFKWGTMVTTFVVTGRTGGCHDNLQCSQWHQSGHHDNLSSSSMLCLPPTALYTPGCHRELSCGSNYARLNGYLSLMSPFLLGHWPAMGWISAAS